jgi:hypothetical protein
VEVVLPGSHGRRRVARVDPPEANKHKARAHKLERYIKLSRID